MLSGEGPGEVTEDVVPLSEFETDVTPELVSDAADTVKVVESDNETMPPDDAAEGSDAPQTISHSDGND